MGRGEEVKIFNDNDNNNNLKKIKNRIIGFTKKRIFILIMIYNLT